MQIFANCCIFFLLAICGGSEMDTRSEKLSHIVNKYRETMNDSNMQLIGIGEGINHDSKKYNSIGVTFSISDLSNVEKARFLIVKAIDNLLFTINSSEEFKDYIDRYPFPIECIDVSIINSNEQEELFSVSNFRNRIDYDVRNPDRSIRMPTIGHSETFAEACAMLEKNKK